MGRMIATGCVLAALASACGDDSDNGGGDDADGQSQEPDGGERTRLAPDLFGAGDAGVGDGDGDGDGVAGGDGDGDGDGSPPGNMQHGTAGESWTFLVYMMADTNLEPFALQDLQEMMQVGSDDTFQIVAQVDRAAGYSAEGIGSLPDWESTKRLRVLDGALEELDDLGEVNSGDTATLSDFISWGVGAYPADRTALIFWDHGGGWVGFGGDESEGEHDLLTLRELATGIGDGLERAGLEQLSLIGFDACLMATVETGMIMRQHGEYLLASEELEPGHGWDYSVLSQIRDAPDSDPLALGRALLDGFAAQAKAEQTEGDITLSLTDLYALDDLASAVAALADVVTGDVDGSAPVIGRALAKAKEFGASAGGAAAPGLVDLADFAKQLATLDASAFGDAASAIETAVQSAVVHQVTGPAATRATGLSIYMPSSPGTYDSEFDMVDMVGPWLGLVKAYLGAVTDAQSGTPPSFSDVLQVTVEDGLLWARGQLALEELPKVANAYLEYGVIDDLDGSLILLGASPADLYDNGLIEGAWDATVLVVEQGLSTAYGYMELEVDGDFIILTVPFAYLEPGQIDPDIVLLTYVLDGSGSVLQETYYLMSESGPGELSPAAGSTIFPLVIYLSPIGAASWEPTDPNTAFDPTQPLGISLEPLDPGTHIYMSLTIEDFAQNQSFLEYDNYL